MEAAAASAQLTCRMTTDGRKRALHGMPRDEKSFCSAMAAACSRSHTPCGMPIGVGIPPDDTPLSLVCAALKMVHWQRAHAVDQFVQSLAEREGEPVHSVRDIKESMTRAEIVAALNAVSLPGVRAVTTAVFLGYRKIRKDTEKYARNTKNCLLYSWIRRNTEKYEEIRVKIQRTGKIR